MSGQDVSWRDVAAVWGTLCSWPRDLGEKLLWDFNSSCLMSCVNIVFCSCLLGAKLSVKVAEVTKAVIENYLVAQHR